MNKRKSGIRICNFVSKLLTNRCRLASILAAIFIFSVTTVYAAPQYNFVRIVDGNYEVTAYTDRMTVGDVISEHGLDVTEFDVVYPDVRSQVTNGLLIVIDRLKKVNLTCDGYTVTYWTDADTFSEFAGQNGITLSETDIINVNPESELDNINDIKITRVEYFSGTLEEEIPYESSVVYDGYLTDGTSYIKSAGEPGIKSSYCDIVYHDKVEVSRTVYSEQIVKNPVNEVICEGVAGRPGIKTVNGHIINYSKVLTCSATAYDLSFQSTGKYPGHPGYGITASGTYAKKGTVAVDPRVIPLGTRMYIESTDGSVVYGICTAEDTGGAIKGNKVDLFYDTNYECMQFGRRSVNVYILE